MPAYKYRLEDGKTKWYASFYYTDWRGEKKRKVRRGFDTRREALDFEHSFLDKGAKDPTILFSDLVENYLAECEPRLKPTTLSNKRFILENKLVPYFGKMRICDIDPITVHHWQNELLEYRDDKGEGYSPTYLNMIHGEFSAIMNYAVKYYNLQGNPCQAAGGIGSSYAEEMNFWTRDQFEQFLACEDKPSYFIAFSILFYTGMRCGELLALTPEDILDDCSISVNKNYEVVDGNEYFLTPKTDKSKRIITIPKSLYDEIKEYIDGMLIEPDERMFYFGHGGLSTEMKRVTKKAGLPPIRLHDTRHSHASMLIDMGFSIKEIADRLGHESPETTWRIYSHLYPGKDRALADELDKVRVPKKPTENTNSES